MSPLINLPRYHGRCRDCFCFSDSLHPFDIEKAMNPYVPEALLCPACARDRRISLRSHYRIMPLGLLAEVPGKIKWVKAGKDMWVIPNNDEEEDIPVAIKLFYPINKWTEHPNWGAVHVKFGDNKYWDNINYYARGDTKAEMIERAREAVTSALKFRFINKEDSFFSDSPRSRISRLALAARRRN